MLEKSAQVEVFLLMRYPFLEPQRDSVGIAGKTPATVEPIGVKHNEAS
jgi:hypothetical protein